MKSRIVIGLILGVVSVGFGIVLGFANVKQGDQDILDQIASLSLQDEQIAQEVAVTESNVVESGIKKDPITSEFIWFNDLLKYVSHEELETIESKLSELFTQYFIEVAHVEDVSNYYQTHANEIGLMTGITNYNDFQLLYKKIRIMPDYTSCQIKLQYETLNRGTDNYYMDIEVVFDDLSFMEYSISINEKTCEFVIK